MKKMVESSKQLEMSSYQLEQISPQIKRFISFVNSHKKPTSEQVENFNEKATQFMKELNKISDTVRQIEQDKDTTNRNPKLESLRNQLLAKVSTLTDKLNKLCKKIGVIDCKSLPVNEKTTKQDSKPQDPGNKNSEKALKAYQPLPSSVRLGFLSLPGLKSHNYQKFLSPKLGSSHLIFTDLLLDVDGKKITRRQPCWQKIITIQKISQLSLLEESNLSILNCLIRLCLFDGVKPISNIVYLPITSTDRERKTWTVTPHNIRKSERAYEVSSDLFVRYNEQNMHVCLLIEVAIVVSKQNTNKIIELSLGWVTIPLYDENGQIISNKTCEYPLQDTLPFETRKADKLSPKDVSLKTRMQNLLFNKTALLTIRFSQPNKEQQDKLDSLPDVLIGLMSYVPFMSYHRDFLASIFPGFRGSNEKDRFILRHVPPEVALFPPTRFLARSFKRNSSKQKEGYRISEKIYSDYFRRVLYPLLWLQDMHFPNIMTSQQFENEASKILLLIDQIRQDIMTFITSSKYKFKLITSEEFTCPIQFTN
ncbi:unnamed protein product [Heterobilharzia americana]|nr:unnamed protein product [Heterobilharzia americana]